MKNFEARSVLSSGNETVDAIGKINITGNIVPPEYFRRIQKSGKPYLVAILILCDLIYWYEPTLARDEVTGQVCAIKKKFKADKLQKSYNCYVDQWGLSELNFRSFLIL